MMFELDELWLKETPGKTVDCGKSFLKTHEEEKKTLFLIVMNDFVCV